MDCGPVTIILGCHASQVTVLVDLLEVLDMYLDGDSLGLSTLFKEMSPVLPYGSLFAYLGSLVGRVKGTICHVHVTVRAFWKGV